MPKRKALPILVGGRPNRIFVDDIKHIHHQIKKLRPKLPKYSKKMEEVSSADE